MFFFFKAPSRRKKKSLLIVPFIRFQTDCLKWFLFLFPYWSYMNYWQYHFLQMARLGSGISFARWIQFLRPKEKGPSWNGLETNVTVMCLDSDVTTSDVSSTVFMWVSHWSKMVYIFNMSNRGTCCLSVGLLLSLFHIYRKKAEFI